MGKTITVPDTVEEVTERLEGLAALLTAKEWEKAALVYAFTKEDKGGRPRNLSDGGQVSDPRLSESKFAQLKITGLEKRQTVAVYRNAWKAAIESGDAPEIEPGDRVVLPDIDWADTRTGTDGYSTPEGAQKTIERIKAKHGPAIIAQQAQDPNVAKSIVDDKKAKKQVNQQSAAKTQKIVKRRQQQAKAAGPDVKGEMADVTDASTPKMDSTSLYNRMRRAVGEVVAAWQEGIREQSFNEVDRHFLGSDLPLINRLVEEFTAFVEAEDDPYTAVKQTRSERNEQFQRDMDEAEAETDIAAGLDDLERYANEAS